MAYRSEPLINNGTEVDNSFSEHSLPIKLDVVYIARTYNLIISYIDLFKVPLKPIILIRSWRYPYLSGCAFLSLYLLLLHPASLNLLVSMLLLFLVIIMVATLFVNYFSSLSPLCRPLCKPRIHNSYQTELSALLDEQNRIHEDVNSFNYFVYSLQLFTNALCMLFEGIHSILVWSNALTSLLFFMFLLFSLLLWIFFSSHYTSLLITYTTLCKPLSLPSIVYSNLIRFNLMHRQTFLKKFSSHESGINSNTQTPQAPNSVSSYSDNLLVSDSPTHATEFDISRRAVTVSRDKHDVCSKCSTVLRMFKKKRKCQHCGCLFCSNCTVKVKKSYLGVTAPSASNLTVDVCVYCSDIVTRTSRPNKLVLQESNTNFYTDKIHRKPFI